MDYLVNEHSSSSIHKQLFYRQTQGCYYQFAPKEMYILISCYFYSLIAIMTTECWCL